MARLLAVLVLLTACSVGCGDDSDMRPPLSSQVGPMLWKVGDVGSVVDTHRYASGNTGAAGANVLTMSSSVLTLSLDMRFDMAHDAARHLLYIESGHGTILRYDLEQAKNLDQLPVAAIGGMDMSPDGATLLVAVGQSALGPQSAVVHRIDLETQTDHVIALPGGTSLTSGSYSVAFIDDERALITVAAVSTAPAPLLMLRLSDEHAEVIGEIAPNTVLVASADRSVIAFAPGDHSSMQFGRYLVAEARIEQATTSARVRSIAVSRDAQQYALATDDALIFLDHGLQVLGQESRAQQFPLGVTYSPSADELCVAWSNRGGISQPMTPPALDVYDGTSRQRIAAIDTLSTFGSQLTNPYGTGRLKISRDGKSLFANVDSAVAMYRLDL